MKSEYAANLALQTQPQYRARQVCVPTIHTRRLSWFSAFVLALLNR